MSKTPQTREEGIELLRQQALAAKRLIAAKKAKDSLVDFARFMMPDPNAPDDPDQSRYMVARHHRVIAAALEEVDKGTMQRLIISLPPRSGKSQLLSRLFPAWFLGRDPYKHMILATYNDTFACDFGRDVRGIMQSDAYKQVFGDVLRRGNASADRLQTKDGGMAVFVGAGGSITGRGADCIVSDTIVDTIDGRKFIADVEVGDRLLSYNADKKRCEWKRVEAVQSRKANGFYRIAYNTGEVLRCTGNHRIWRDGAYARASSISSGDSCLRSVWQGGAEEGLRGPQGAKAGAQGFLLWPEVQHEAPFVQEQAAVREVQRAGSEKDNALLQWLQTEIKGSEAFSPGIGDDVSTMPEQVFEAGDPRERADVLLQPSVREFRSLKEDAQRGQSEVASWDESCEATASFSKGISAYASEDTGKGQSSLCCVREREEVALPPHRLQPDEQQFRQPDNYVREVPHETSCWSGFKAEEVFVSSIEKVGEEAVVYDLQIEDNHNFFADGILVHNCLVIDDPIKGREDADSPAQREKLWGWFLDVAMTRLMDVGARVSIAMTRWHEDDLVGRLIDPENPCYNKEQAAKWKVLNLPALAERDDPLGREEGESIWPERFTREYYEEARRQNPRGFSALYQGRPAPEDGDFFKKEWIQGYTRDELPQRLRYYCASDHAVTANQERDPTCLIPVGICERNHIWVLPDVWWRHAETDTVVDAMLGMIQRYRPLKWWAERGHVSKAIGPFLRKRMQEEEAYCAIDEVVPSADKQTRAQSIQGRMAMGMVHLPKFAGWYQKAVNEILKFPNGRHDDFVDTLSLIGLGLQSLIGAGAPVKKKSAPKTGTLAWVKESSKREARRKMIRLNSIE